MMPIVNFAIYQMTDLYRRTNLHKNGQFLLCVAQYGASGKKNFVDSVNGAVWQLAAASVRGGSYPTKYLNTEERLSSGE